MESFVNTRYWTTGTYARVYLNEYIFHSLKFDILKRVINNQMSGSSWYFKTFSTFSSENFRWRSRNYKIMSEYINFEADADFIDADSGKEDEEVSFVSESSFNDDQEIGNDVDFYRQYQVTNVKSNIDQVAEARKEALADIEHFDVWSLSL